MSTLPNICLVDTNVVIVANGPNLLVEDQYCCIEPCVTILEHIKGGKCKLVLDDTYEIITEYLHHIDSKKQKGMGEAFLKWTFDHMSNSDNVELVHITPQDDSYKEFPSHEGLREFDRSDRKFVAAANAHKDKPPIVQATDSKW